MYFLQLFCHVTLLPRQIMALLKKQYMFAR